jgi:ribonuclease J
LAAREAGRDIVMAGQSLKRTYAAARECGYLGDLPPFLEDEFARYLPRGRSLIVCTGGQGESRAALARIAQGEHPHVALEQGRRGHFFLARDSRQRTTHRPAAKLPAALGG